MARIRTTTRRLYVFSLHAHVGKKPLGDYRRFFADLIDLPAPMRVYERFDRLVAISRVEVDGHLVRLTAYEGPPGVQPLFFDPESDSERLGDLHGSEVIATRTRAVVNLNTRDVAVEFNQRGAKATDIARALGSAGRNIPRYRDLTVELVPVAAPSFAEAVEKFERIRFATVNIAKPNTSWITQKNNAIELVRESDGNRIELAVYAEPGGSLSKKKGIVKIIKGLTRESRATVKNASVVGTRPGEGAEARVSLERHLEQRNITVPLSQSGHVDTRAIDQRLVEFVDARDTPGRSNEE